MLSSNLGHVFHVLAGE
uniref:Uncharacterized protein n=1 Tax=Rhizophora mucronata TaxID=61149 RepID=A0A2P2QD97_RHIMU